MAVCSCSPTATLHITAKNIPTISHSPKFGLSNPLCFTRNKPLRFYIKCSGDVSADTTATEAEPDSESSIEVPQESASLISALNVERALRGIPITDADHYGRLGIPRGCSFEKVAIAYNNKVAELKSEGLEEDELNKKMELLNESYRILSSDEERRIYDWSLARTENTETCVWPFEVDITQTPKGTPPPQEPEDVGPTILVGYFIVGWIILSFVLSIALPITNP